MKHSLNQPCQRQYQPFAEEDTGDEKENAQADGKQAAAEYHEKSGNGGCGKGSSFDQRKDTDDDKGYAAYKNTKNSK